jgi:hypothetical protein
VRSLEEFDVFLETTLLPELRREQALHAALRQRRRAVQMPLGTKAVVWVIGLALAVALKSGAVFWLAFVGPFSLDLFRMMRIPAPRPRDLKRDFVGRVIQFWDPSFAYQPHAHVSARELRESRLLDENFDACTGSDQVSGKFGSTAFRLSEVKLTRKTKDSRKTVFSGLFLVADFNKSFRSRLFVLPDATERHLGMVARALQSLPSHGRGNLIELESPEFERHFKVYGNDPVEARYILSPGLMRRLVNLRQQTGVDVRLAFAEEHVYLLMPLEKDLFHVGYVEQIDEQAIRAWVGDLFFAAWIIEELDLDTRIWSKAPA